MVTKSMSELSAAVLATKRDRFNNDGTKNFLFDIRQLTRYSNRGREIRDGYGHGYPDWFHIFLILPCFDIDEKVTNSYLKVYSVKCPNVLCSKFIERTNRLFDLLWKRIGRVIWLCVENSMDGGQRRDVFSRNRGLIKN